MASVVAPLPWRQASSPGDTHVLSVPSLCVILIVTSAHKEQRSFLTRERTCINMNCQCTIDEDGEGRGRKDHEEPLAEANRTASDAEGERGGSGQEGSGEEGHISEV